MAQILSPFQKWTSFMFSNSQWHSRGLALVYNTALRNLWIVQDTRSSYLWSVPHKKGKLVAPSRRDNDYQAPSFITPSCFRDRCFFSILVVKGVLPCPILAKGSSSVKKKRSRSSEEYL